MRRVFCVPMISLLLLLAACGKENHEELPLPRDVYQTMTGCMMEAEVSCLYEDHLWAGRLRCDHAPVTGESVIEILSPETAAGVRAVLQEDGWQLEYEDLILPIRGAADKSLGPMTCLPRLMHALRDGWLLEENEELWGETHCIRLMLDSSAEDNDQIVSTVWLRMEDGMPLRGEIAVGGEIILTAEFTAFSFYDKIGQQDSEKS